MIRKHSFLILTLIALFALAPVVSAQAPFSIRVQMAQSSATVADGGAVNLQADAIGAVVPAAFSISYTGSTTVNINSIEYSGANDFSLAGAPDLSGGAMTIGRTQALTFSARYQPATSVRAAGRIAISWTEGRTSGTLSINLTGVAPEFVFSYTPQGGNQVQVAPGGVMQMALTNVSATSNTSVIVTNKGSGAGVINGVSASGAAFALAGLPLPQTSVDAGKDLRFTIAFTPDKLAPSAGRLQVALFDRTVSFDLVGEGSGPEWAYETIQESTISAILAGAPISMPEAVVGEKSTMLVRVRNIGNAEGRIVTPISITGAAFSLTDAPFVPLVLAAGSSASMTVTFAPTQAGRAIGRLRIGNDSFEISGNGLGPVLQYAYAVGSTSLTVANNGQVVFAPVAVGRTASVIFTINNTGTAPASIGSISVVQTGTVFGLAQVPALPVTVQPGRQASFQVSFAPITLGASSATLRLDSQTFTLSGTGNTPAALPEYRFEGPAGAQEPMAQPAVGLVLAQAYPLALSGTLTLNFYSEVGVSDPAVQFATGGRTVNFTVAANSTRAVFANNANQIRVQTGSVAGSIALTPSFQTTEGKIDLTPLNPASFSLSVPQTAPRLLGVAITGKTNSGFSLLITGMATGRSITQIDVEFVPTSGETVSTTRVTLPVESSFLAWYTSTASQAFGSLFTATVPFTFSGDLKNVSTLVDTIQSVSVRLTNRQGSSASQSVNLK